MSTESLVVLSFGNAEFSTASSGDGAVDMVGAPKNVEFLSTNASQLDRTFSSPPVLTITLAGAIDIEQGINLEFDETNYCTDLDVEYQNASTTTIVSENYTPDNYNFFCELSSKPVADAKYIVITFNETAVASSKANLMGVYIDEKMWDKNNIVSMQSVEEASLPATEAISGSLEFTIRDGNANFSIVDLNGIYAFLKDNLPIAVWEFIDDSAYKIGVFYLSDWKSPNKNTIADFTAVGALQLLEKEYLGGYFSAADASDVLDDIMNGEAISYGIAPVIQTVQVDGLFDISPKRYALSKLALVIGGYVKEDENGGIYLYAQQTSRDIGLPDFTLDVGDIAQRVIEKGQDVSGVDISTYAFTPSTDRAGEILFSGVLDAGTYTLKMQEGTILSDASLTGGTTAIVTTPITVNANYVQFAVTSSGVVEIQIDETLVQTEEAVFYSNPAYTGSKENRKNVKGVYCITKANSGAVAYNLLKYYTQKYKMDFLSFAEDLKVGDSVKVSANDAETKFLAGILERIENDLAAGYRQKATVRADTFPYSVDWYAIDYLIAGGGGSGGTYGIFEFIGGGGGGAGQVLTGKELVAVGDVYSIAVGAGGVTVIATDTQGNNGYDSSFAGHVAAGGGGGGHRNANGSDGGNGGGAGSYFSGGTKLGGTGVMYDGGDANSTSTARAGGGGGAYEDGSNGTSTSIGNGGDGIPSSITGSEVYYGGGGGGGVNQDPTTQGGNGGGGAGGNFNDPDGGAGTDGLGGGGGGGNYSIVKHDGEGGAGGSGVVILRMLTSDYSGIVTGSPTVTVDGDYTVAKFANNGSYTPGVVGRLAVCGIGICGSGLTRQSSWR